MKILAVSDQVIERVYSLASNGHFKDVDMIIGCGDLPYVYLEYLVTILDAPLFYVPGNHDPDFDPHDVRSQAEGGSNLDLKTVACNGFLIGGFGGSARYRPDGANQHTQAEAFLRAFRMFPRLALNRIRYGRALDVLISHSPPFGIHDDTDNPHRGLKALNWLHRIAAPRLHLHGHTHFYRGNIGANETQSGATRVINVYPYKIIDLDSKIEK
ncbi:MAG: metallophosphoesterase [Chloroflexi bacterium CFX1]|nr:metallophosphoesterase [Chloroflexi bacterium CFX1]MCQ3953235.1 metallophosphoesterase [Chloroflexota bacterium]MDL1920047.1 metallophosphoesterase [Chloroflexi bacterium CFX5]NUQ59115.1 metallophosphoesterase family protein [Anaerolineales bacterium]